jgi:hypothetical protein
MKRIVIISDLHCGSRSGLTPPAWQWPTNSKNRDRRKYAEMQARVWAYYEETLAALQPIDCLVVNGDAIDGKGERSGGTELLEADRNEQALMAAECIRVARAKQVVIVRGTPYHVGKEDDFESAVAALCGANKIGDHEWIEAEGIIFDLKHKVGSSSIPHGRNTAPQRAALWNALWAERGLQPRARVIVRSHVHYHVYSGDVRKLVLTTPALQGWTKFGAKECEGTTDVGLVHFDCEGGNFSWVAHLLDLQWAAAKPYKV